MQSREQVFDQFRRQLPVDVYGLAQALDLDLVEKELDADISGLIEPKEGRFRISVNQHHHSFRKRFTIAHELGHWLYHAHLIGDGLEDNRLYYSSNRERYYNDQIRRQHENQANAFAAWLLIPEGKLIEDLRRFKDEPNWDYLSERYQISKSALKIKARSLLSARRVR